MGWSLGGPDRQGRYVGYGVPAWCDHPGCKKKIDRGISYVCGGQPFGGEHGCGLYFCGDHLTLYEGQNPYGEDAPQLCDVCVINFRLGADNYKSFAEQYDPKPEHPQWTRHLLNDLSWKEWRDNNPEKVKELRASLTAQ